MPARGILVPLLGLLTACSHEPVGPPGPAPAQACGQTQGDDPSPDAIETARRCEEDPAGTHCATTDLLTEDAARCAAAAVDAGTIWSGGLFYDRVAHRPVWRMFASLRHEQPTEHRHLLLDGASGAPVEMLTVDGSRSKLLLETPGADPAVLPEFSGNLLVIGDRLVGFDARAGKKFAESFKVASRSISGGGETVTVHAIVEAEGDEQAVTFEARIGMDDEEVRLVTTVPVDERRVSLDLYASRPGAGP